MLRVVDAALSAIEPYLWIEIQTFFGDVGAILICLGSPRHPSEAMTFHVVSRLQPLIHIEFEPNKSKLAPLPNCRSGFTPR